MAGNVDVQRLQVILEAQTKQFERAMLRYGNTAEAAARRAELAFERQNKRFRRSVNQMSSTLRNAVAGVAVGLAAREVIQYADAWTEAGNKIAAAGTPLEQQAQRLGELADLAIETRSSFDATSSLFARLGIATENLTGKQYDLLKVTELINKATVAGGASTAERASTVLQLSQALASGQLMGEELRSLRENAPLLMKALADEFDTTIGKLKDLGAEGKLTAERVLDAILAAEGEIEGRFSKTNVTIGDSFTNLQTRVTQYIGTMDDSLGASEKLAGAIMFVADNVDAFAEALVVAGAALTGALGAAATASAIASLSKIGALMWGPTGLIIGAGALAAAFAYFALQGNAVSRSLDKVEGALEGYRKVSADIQDDTARLTELQDRLSNAIEDQQPIIEATARADIAALNTRIAKNKELQAVLASTARAEMTRLRTEESQAASPFSGYTADRGFRVEGSGESAAAINRGDSGFSVLASDAAEAAELQAQLERQILGYINQRADAGELISDQEQAVLDAVSAQLQRQERIASLAEQIAQLGTDPAEAQPTSARQPTSVTGGGETDKSRRDAVKALAEIEEAHRKLYTTEREQIEHAHQARLTAIAELKASNAEKDEAILQSAGIRDAELAELDQKEAERAAQALERAQQERDREISFMQQVMDSRDQMTGRLSSILDREYAMKREQIMRELSDREEQNQALLALEAERIEAEKQLRDELLQEGGFSDDPLERFRTYMDDRQSVLADALELEKITWKEYLQELAEMKQEYLDIERENEIANQQTILSATQGFISAMTNLAEQRFGKNSALTKALFLAEKIAAAAQVILSGEVAKIRALAELGPIAGPPAAAAIEVAKNISLATIAAQTVAGFKDGVIGLNGPGTGTSDSIPARLSRGESVITARATGMNSNVLQAINRGADIEGVLGRLASSQSAAAPNIRIINNAPGVVVRKEGPDMNPRFIIEQATAGAMAALQEDIASGGDTSRLMESQYALNRAAGNR